MPSSSSHSVSKKFLRDESFCDGMILTLGHDEAFRGRGFGTIEVGGTSVHLTSYAYSCLSPRKTALSSSLVVEPRQARSNSKVEDFHSARFDHGEKKI